VIALTINETASEMLKQAWQPAVMRDLRWTMAEQNQATVGEIRRYNRGKGPYSPEQHRLGVVTNRWRSSVRATVPRVSGDVLTASIGSNVEYAGAHEFGFRGQVQVKGHLRHVKSRNKYVKIFEGGKLRRRLSVTGYTTVAPHSKNLDLPARAPITYGIEQHKAKYEAAFSRSIINTLKGLGFN